jgi:tetratricopeptide (TPR) repeat protein
MEGIAENEFEIYKDVVNGAYRFHDMMLETLLELAGPDTTVILVSDHGFHSDHLRPRGIPDEPAGPAVQHRQFGIVGIKGPQIKQDERIYGATLLDVTPTILTMFGLPVGADMDGRVLVQAFEQPPKIERIPSWEQEAGECGMHPADLRMDPLAARAVIERFVALGYIQPPSDDQAKAVEMAVREQHYNLARAYMDARRHADALPLLQELVKKSPDEARFSQHLAQCFLALRRRAEAKAILQQLISKPPKPVSKEKDGTDTPSPDTASRDEAGAEALKSAIKSRTNSEAASEEKSAAETPAKQANAAETKAETEKDRPWADLMMGVIHFDEGNMDEALACMLKAERFDPRLPDLHLRIGNVYLRQKRADDAERAFCRALEIDGDSAAAHLGLAMAHLRKRRNQLAAEQALIAVGLQHFLPLGHFYLGVALARLGHCERATLAFETSLTMLPGLMAAHRWLAALYQQPGGDPENAARHRSIYLQMRRQRESQAQA